MKNLLFSITMFFWVHIGYAQLVQFYPGISRYDVTVDEGDTVWTGSRNGLVKFHNGVTQNYSLQNSGIASNNCYVVSIDSIGRIWAGGDSGISIFDKTNWTILNSSNSQLPANRITAFCQTTAGCWIGTYYGLSFYDGNTWTTYSTANSGIINDNITSIDVNNNIIYIATNAGISVFENGTWTNWPSGQNGLANGSVRKIMFAGGRLWTEGSYLDQGIFQNINNLINSEVASLIYLSFKSLCKDENGNVYTSLNTSSFLKIAPDFSLTYFKFNSLFSSLTLPSSIFKNGKIYMVTQVNYTGINITEIDTSAIQPIAYIPGMVNDFLNVNNTVARILNRGDMHWDPVAQVPQYRTPFSQQKNPVFCSAIWLGGLDQGGQLHTAAMTYRHFGASDFWPGPLDTISGTCDSSTSAYFDRFWKIDHDMLQGFQINFQNGNLQNGTYALPEAIASWPAHGNGNYSRNLAPFIDVNNDGVYNPYDGDYPELTGHQMLWWVFNDTMLYPHTESGGAAFQFEIQGKAYGYNCNLNSVADEVMNNTTFYQYKIVNRSNNTYSDSYIGLWSDFDLGNATDDYVGCDSMLNTFFCYNGDNNDDGGYGYGLNPPMMNVSILKGPIVQSADGLDNNHNGLIDETGETSGMSSFEYGRKSQGISNGFPENAEDYYEHLRGLFNDGSAYVFGGTGYDPGNPNTTKYQFSGIPYLSAPNNWTMASAGIQPDDMRAMGASGPFTIAPGESQTIDFAYIFTRDSLNPNGIATSIAKNTSDVQKIINGFTSGSYPCLTSVGVSDLTHSQNELSLYPNPATNLLFFNKEMLGSSYQIFNITGQIIHSGIYSGAGIAIEKLNPQLYIVKVQKENQQFVKRFIKM